ncbi:MAG: tetratricopeptide repeat protein [Magnetococcus sp. DMHC-1]
MFTWSVVLPAYGETPIAAGGAGSQATLPGQSTTGVAGPDKSSQATLPGQSTTGAAGQNAGAQEAEAGQAALDNGDVDEALHHFLKAVAQSGTNEEILRTVAHLSREQGNNGQAIDYFKRAMQLAVKGKRYDRIAEYNAQIRALASTRPEAMEARLEKAMMPPAAGAAQYLPAWSALMEQAATASAKGQNGETLRLLRAALSLAKEHFGSTHYFVLTTQRDLAIHLYQTGQRDQARTLLTQTIDAIRKTLGEDHAETLAMQSRLGNMLEGSILFMDALKVYTEVQQGYSKSLGADHPDTLNAARALVKVQQNLGQLDTGGKILQEVCQKLADQLGPWHAERIECLDQLSWLLTQQGRYPEAEKSYLQLLDLRQATQPAHALSIREAQLGLAGVYRLQAQYEPALQILKQLLADGENKELAFPEGLLVRIRDLLAQVYEDRGQFAEAETLARQTVAQKKQLFGADHPNTIASLNSLAGILKRSGQLDESEKIYQDTLQRARKALGEKHPTTIAILNNLGLIFEQQGLYDQAEPMFKEALKVGQELLGEEHPTTMTIMSSLALLYEGQGNFDKARPLYDKAIAISTQRVGRNHPDTLALVNNLAYLEMIRQDYSSAEKQFQEVVTQWQASLGEKNQKTLKGMNNLARTLHKLHRLDEAEGLFKKTLALRQEVLGASHMDTLRSMQDLAALYRDQGRSQEADTLFQETAQLEEKILGPQHPYTFETLNGWAMVKDALHDSEAALRLRHTVFLRRTEFLNRMMWVVGDNARAGYVTLHLPEYSDYLTLLSRLEPARGGEELLEAGLARKGLLLKVSSEIQQIARLTADPLLKKLIQELTATRKELATMTLSGPKEGVSGEAHVKQLRAMEDRINTLEADLGRASLRFRQNVAAITVKDLVEKLPESSLLVDFLIYREGSSEKMVAGLLRKENGQPKFGMVGYKDMEAIQKQVIKYRTILQDENAAEEDFKEVGNQLYNMIWKPLEEFIGKQANVYVIPDGILNIMPFNALVNDRKEYLLQNVDLHILNSSRDLVTPELPVVKNGKMVILAGPDYSSENVSGRKALVEARKAAGIKTQAGKLANEKAQIEARKAAGKRALADAQNKRSTLKDTEKEAETEMELAAVEGETATEGGSGRRSAATSQLRAGLRAFSVGMRGLRFDLLPGALQEGELISQNVSKSHKENRLFVNHDAQEETLKTLGEVPDMLHIATHGFFLKADENLKKRLLKLQRGADIHMPPPGDNPLLRAGLAFSGINVNASFLGDIDTGNDGVLTALEAMNLNLTGTRLVVLSACETGLGEIHEGEGVYGLRRAFQEAGAANVMSSLWEVSDAGTQALMTGFYKRILAGTDPRKALRESQLALLNSSEWNYPYIWSAFMMVGK